MSIAGVLARGRAAALQLMRDTCLIERKTGRTWNSTTGEYTDVWTTVYAGMCGTKPAGGGHEAALGESPVTLRRYAVKLPWDVTPEILREDRCTITASADSWLIGRPQEVVDIDHSATATARRIAVEYRS